MLLQAQMAQMGPVGPMGQPMQMAPSVVTIRERRRGPVTTLVGGLVDYALKKAENGSSKNKVDNGAYYPPPSHPPPQYQASPEPSYNGYSSKRESWSYSCSLKVY